MMKESTDEQKYMAAIWREQQETNRLLCRLIDSLGDKTNANVTGNTKRADIIARIKQLPNKPKGWTKLSNDKLLELLKRGEC